MTKQTIGLQSYPDNNSKPQTSLKITVAEATAYFKITPPLKIR